MFALTVFVNLVPVAVEVTDCKSDSADVMFAAIAEYESHKPWGGCERGVCSAEIANALRKAVA